MKFLTKEKSDVPTENARSLKYSKFLPYSTMLDKFLLLGKLENNWAEENLFYFSTACLRSFVKYVEPFNKLREISRFYQTISLIIFFFNEC